MQDAAGAHIVDIPAEFRREFGNYGVETPPFDTICANDLAHIPELNYFARMNCICA